MACQFHPALPPPPTPCLWQGCPLLLWHLDGHASPTQPDPRCEPRIETRDGGRIIHWNVADELDGVRRSARGQHVEVAPGAWIRLFGVHEGRGYELTFAIGDAVARGHHTASGVIVAIDATSITLCDGTATQRLSLYEFQFQRASLLREPDPACVEDVGAATDPIDQSGSSCRESHP